MYLNRASSPLPCVCRSLVPILQEKQCNSFSVLESSSHTASQMSMEPEKSLKKPGHTFRSGKPKRKKRTSSQRQAPSQASTLNAAVISQQGHRVQRTTVVFGPGDVHQTLIHLQQPLQPHQREQKSRQKQGLPYQDQNETLSLFTGNGSSRKVFCCWEGLHSFSCSLRNVPINQSFPSKCRCWVRDML